MSLLYLYPSVYPSVVNANAPTHMMISAPEFFQPIVHILEVILFTLMYWVHATIDALGYLGVALLMAIESANIPLPSELILPYAGFLVQQGKMNFHLAALAGAVGCVLGSWPCYVIGARGGEDFLRKYGKWLLLTTHDLESAKRWSAKWGDMAFFVCRMLPVLRTFISLPAGILKIRFGLFMWLTFLGSWVWSYALVYVGVLFGENLEAFKHFWHKFDALILGVLFVLGVLYVYKHVKPMFAKP
jgi:membrane protein DedA with SNARE-associated domain